MTATAMYLDAYGPAEGIPAKLVARKTTSRGAKAITYRWFDDRGFCIDGLRPGVYSVAYQLRHARRHACFADVREA